VEGTGVPRRAMVRVTGMRHRLLTVFALIAFVLIVYVLVAYEEYMKEKQIEKELESCFGNGKRGG
jgi:hypothetical protein